MALVTPLISVGEWNLDVITLVYIGLMLSIVWGAVDQEWQSWKRRRRLRREQRAQTHESAPPEST